MMSKCKILNFFIQLLIMNFKSISSIPIRELSEISSQLTRDEMNNIRIVRQKEKENYNKKFIELQEEIKEPVLNDIKSEGKEQIINKLRLLLSKKYELSLNDYIILIDKFKLDSTNLNRTNIIALLDYLNTKSNFSQNSINIISQKEDTIDSNIVNSFDLEQKFEILEQERNEMLKKIINNGSINNKDTSAKFSFSNMENNEKLDFDYNRKNIADTIKENIILDISQKTRDQFDITSKDSTKNLNTDISVIPPKKTTDILLINLLEYEIDGDFCITIDYNNQNTIENIEKIDLVACNINKTFCDKNGISKKPHFIIRIEEFDNNFYVNGNNLKGFCQILLEKKNSIYTYVNKELIFGNYSPENKFKLSKLNISLMDLSGNKLTNLKYTDNDQLNIILKIERNIM
jgi:hypothetical protein